MRSGSLALTALVLGSAHLAAQSPVASVEISADSVAMAEAFQLRVHIDVPPGRVVYFSDTLPATAEVESVASATWRAERADGGAEGAALELTYPIMSFGVNEVAVPTPDVLIGPADGAEGDEIPGGSLVGAWADAPATSGRRFQRVRIPEARVWVRPVQSEAEVATAQPRGPDDVLGTSWSWPHVMLVGFFSSILAVAGTSKTREWLDGRKRSSPGTGTVRTSHEEARLAVLGVIDRLIADGPYGADREKGVYAASSDALRGYAARLATDWVPGLTSTELMRRFEAEAEAVTHAMAIAERVKFGRYRTGGDALQAHLSTLRAWLAETRA